MVELLAVLLRPLRTGALFAGCLAVPLAADTAQGEFEIKAKIVQVIGSYVAWPRGDPSQAKRPFVIVVLGRSPFGRYLDEACRTKTVQGRPIQVIYRPDLQATALEGCDIAFLCTSLSGKLPELLALAKGKPVFLMADTPGMARRGIMLNLLLTGNTVGLEINLKAARAASLEISSALLSLSKEKSRLVETE